jgi:glyoxylase-like metal-dependent hydrolase (beta-lactamase superfamily II)
MNNVVLAPGLQAIVRDWLDANHVLITSADESVLIDTGCSAHAARTLALLRHPQALGARPLDRIVNTHCHSDHMGGNAAIAGAYGASITVPLDAVPIIDAWDTRELLLDYADQQADRFAYDHTIAAGAQLELGGIQWLAFAAPGHDMTALVFYAPKQRVLVSGDALWEHGFGLVEPLERLEERLAAQRATLECIAKLDVARVVPGHGAPFCEVGAALGRAFQRLDAYAADPLKLARHCLKAFFMFALLARGRFAYSELPAYFERVACYREYNERFFRLTPRVLADKLVGELLRAGAIKERDGELVPAGD